MFYSESLSSPINSYNVKRLYGVNPDNDPARAAAIGIFPLTEAPEGYTASHYAKEANVYTTVPHCISIEEMKMVMMLRELSITPSELEVALTEPEY